MISGFALGQTTDGGATETSIKLVGDLQFRAPPIPQAVPATWPVAEIESSPLPVGETYNLELKLRNSTESDIRFRKIVVSCVCTEIKIDTDVLRKDDESIILVRYKAPEGITQNRFVIRINFFGDEDSNRSNPVAEIDLIFPLAGNLAIDNTNTHLELAPMGLSEFWFPVVYSSPIAPENLATIKSDEFRDLIVNLAQKDSKWFLVLQTAQSAIPPEGLRGRIGIRDLATGVKKDFEISVFPRKKVTVSPQVLRFRIDDEDSGIRQGMALLRISPEPGKAEIPEFAELGCFLGTTQLEMDLRSLGNGVHRALISITKEQIREFERLDDPKQIEWRFRLEGQTEVLTVTTGLMGDLK